jgi:hypothetical protein
LIFALFLLTLVIESPNKFTIMRFLQLLLLVLFSSSLFSQQSRFELINASGDGSSTTLRFELGDYTFSDVQTSEGIQQIIRAEGAALNLEKGSPDLPLFHQALMVPSAEGMKVEVVEADFEEIQNMRIAASQGNLKRTQNPSEIGRVKGLVYQQNQWYPIHPASLKSPYIFRNTRAQSLELAPFQYNPVTQTLRIYHSITLQVSVDSESPVVNRLSLSVPMTAEEQQAGKRMFINAGNERYNALPNGSRMLIICHDAFIPALEPFRNWKLRCGIETELIPASQAGDETQIANLIRNRYENQGLQYVLLVGDIAQIPSPTRSGGRSDPSYGYLVGDDAYPEVIVGRLSAEEIKHVETQIQKILEYEQASIGAHFPSMVGIASQEGPGDDNELDFEHMRNMRSDLLSFTYTQGYELYEGNQGGEDGPEWPQPADLSTALTSGAGLILYTGHGSSVSFGTSEFDNNDINQLQNQGKLPVIWSVACVNGEFDNGTCFAETWMRARQGETPTGAAAVLMSSINQSWNPPMCAQDEMVDILTGQIANAPSRRFGSISMNGCMKMNDEYAEAGDEMTDTWHIFGDPSMLMRSMQPMQMQTEHPVETPIGTSTLNVLCNVEGAIVTLVQDGQLIASEISSGGQVYFSFEPLSSISPIEVTSTAFNYTPYQGIVNVVANDQPFLVYQSNQLSDLAGNSNQLADYGESLLLNVRVRNVGTPLEGMVTATIQTTSPWVELNDPGLQCIFNVEEGTEFFVSDNCFGFEVSNQVPDQTTAVFQLLLTDGQGLSWTINVPVLLNAPKIRIVQYSVTEVQGNGNMRPDEGETINISFTVTNQGHSAALPGDGMLLFGESYSTQLTASDAFDALMVGETAIHSYNFQLIESIPAGAVLPFEYTASHNYYSDFLSNQLFINLIVEDWEADHGFNWAVDGSSPWVNDDAQVYEGDYSMKSGSIQDNQQTVLSLNYDVSEPGTIGFYRKVSSEEGWDFLRFYIDDVEVAAWSGNLDWESFSFPVGIGNHTFTWTYMKDEIVSDLMDAAWVDFITLPPASDVTSIDNSVSSSGFQVFPNPTEGLIHVVVPEGSGDAHLTLFDVGGRLVFESNPNDQLTSIQLPGDLTAGVYMLALQTEKGREVKKLLIH